MKRLCAAFLTAFAGVFLCSAASAQTTDAGSNSRPDSSTRVVQPLFPMAVPGTSADNPFTSFDISYTDPQLQ